MQRFAKEKIERQFYSNNLELYNWEVVQQELEQLLEENIDSKSKLIEFIARFNEFYILLMEEYFWNFVNLSRDTNNQELKEKKEQFNDQILNKAEDYFAKIKDKIFSSPFLDQLPERLYGNYKKILAKDNRIYTSTNNSLLARDEKLGYKYRELISNLSVSIDGEEKNLSQLKKELKHPNRAKRESAWRLLNKVVLENKDDFDQLFDEMVQVRTKVARNAGFNDYRDYKHLALGRFEYTPEDLEEFHKSVEKVVVPIVKELNQEKKKILGIKKLRPWDVGINSLQRTLIPFQDSNELLDKTIKILNRINPYFAEKLIRIREKGYFDLDTRKGKNPGGYCFTVENSGECFIFMNSTGNPRETNILLHESGHCLHSFASAKYPIREYRMMNSPTEIIEFAAQILEIIGVEYLDEYYQSERDLKLAKRQQLESVIRGFIWRITVDAFQHWVYTNPGHTAEERTEYFNTLINRFNPGIDWTGLEVEQGLKWLRTLHIFAMPFYYIEYAISQLGAIAFYKNFKQDKDKALQQYQEFLNLGYSRPIPELYKRAGVQFNFSEKYLRENIEFIKNEIEKL